MKTSKAGIDLIKQFEGCRLKAYKPVAAEKYWTIGWGHYGPDVTEGMTITQARADIILEDDLKKYEGYVATYVSLPLNQNEFDALVSFTYNCGAGNLKSLVKNRNKAQIAEAMLLYNKGADKKVLAGLVRRRKLEHDLFLSGSPTIQSTKKVTKDVIVKIYNGEYGSGDTRKKKIEADGYNYEEVRSKVNEISKLISQMQALKKEAGEYFDLVLSKA